jgi:hypothetical protein
MEFRACKFVKEDSCLLGKLGKVFDLAEQQGLPGRDAQMAEVKEGAKAVAERLETDARCRVTVLSRGPGSGKSTTMVFIADNWETVTGRTRVETPGIQSGPIVCQWTYNSKMSSRISQEIWPDVTGEQAAVARCLHGTLSCMGCEPIGWDDFLQKLGDTQNQELLPKSLTGVVNLMIDLFGEGRDVLIMVDELMLAAQSSECYFPDGYLQKMSDEKSTTPSPKRQDYLELAGRCCQPMEACRTENTTVFTLLSALTFNPTEFKAWSPRPVTSALLTPLNFSAAFKYGIAYCPGVTKGIIRLVCGLTNGHPRLLNNLLIGLQKSCGPDQSGNRRRTPTGPQEYKAALELIGRIYGPMDEGVSNKLTEPEGSERILLDANQVFEYAFEHGGFTKKANEWDAQEVEPSILLRQLVQNGQVSLVPDASAKERYRVDLIPLAIIFSLGGADMRKCYAFPRVKLLWERLYDPRAGPPPEFSSDAWQAWFDGSNTVGGSRPGPQLAEQMGQFFMASALAEPRCGRGDQVRKAIFPGLDTELHWSDPEVPSLFDYFVRTLKLSDEKAETACRRLDRGCRKCELSKEDEAGRPGLGFLGAIDVEKAIADGDVERVLRANGGDYGINFDVRRSSFERCPEQAEAEEQPEQQPEQQPEEAEEASGDRTETRAASNATNSWNTLWRHVEKVTLPALQQESEAFWKAHFVLPPERCPGIDTLIIFYRKDVSPVFMGAQQKAWRSELDDTTPKSMVETFKQLKSIGGLSQLGGREYPWHEIDGEVVKLRRVWLNVAGAEDADIPKDMKPSGKACTNQGVPLTVVGATALRNHFVPALASLASCGTGTGDPSQKLTRAGNREDNG